MRAVEPYSRRMIRRRRRDWLRALPRFVVVSLGVGLIVLLGITTAVVLSVSRAPVSWYVLGLVQAGLVSVALHGLHLAFLARDQEAIRHLRGAWGEENTRDELLRARRRRLIWGWANSVTLRWGDLDHVVVSRAGGVVVLDSKWRNEVTREGAIEMARAATRARTRASGMVQTVFPRESGARHRARLQPVTVRSAVVLWGASQDHLPPDAEIDGIRFVRGRDLLAYLRELDGDVVSKHSARDLLDRIEGFRATATSS